MSTPASYHECDTASAPDSTMIVAVVGPTASGKSDLALDLAERLPALLGAHRGELVSADSMQFYRGMDIGTAKTPINERRGIPHHQIDTLDVTEEPSAAQYQVQARADIAAIHQRGNLAVVAGGSGLYQRALLDTIDFPGTDPAIRARYEALAQGPYGPRGLHERLKSLDPLSAERIDAHNTRRLVRALEVIELTGKPYSATMPRHVFHQRAVMIAIAREMDDLDLRIGQRTRKMFADGLIDEVRELILRGLRQGRTASKATGYAQALAVIDGAMTIDEATDAVALATRQLARKQLKWLRPDPRIIWLPATHDSSLSDRACEAVLAQCSRKDSNE
ncbi:tRNA (adenosine(37)-N6)-dimethylallyltransferase MiaA [Schaalia suimastitidis]|uniref:tRNA (adenosine(37)-N6)-dimethylallyltransferase MiaA n=1 Tax=Schaalia suimastitidis TaxID=121163 RepID=UPI00041A4351|nr:tRNA (adenosine(37)-N6)-dimethylallyltransferase MiaA [Schaalia suimastitidis]